MSDLHLYLNDHLAGSIAALELIDHLIEGSEDEAQKAFFNQLRDEIKADQGELEKLLRELGAGQSEMRKAAAWLLEKISRVKLGSGDSGLGLLQALEGLVLGITGKRALWRNLAAAAATNPGLRGLDYARLEARAGEQIQRVETQARQLAARVLNG